jgi:hypothetical protein
MTFVNFKIVYLALAPGCCIEVLRSEAGDRKSVLIAFPWLLRRDISFIVPHTIALGHRIIAFHPKECPICTSNG